MTALERYYQLIMNELEGLEAHCCDNLDDRHAMADKLSKLVFELTEEAHDRGWKSGETIGREDGIESCKSDIRRLRVQLEQRSRLIIKMAWKLVDK